MIQVYSGRTWLCLIIIPLRKYMNNLINIFEDILELLQHKWTWFLWLPCEQENIASPSQAQNTQLLFNFTSAMERTAASISLSLYFLSNRTSLSPFTCGFLLLCSLQSVTTSFPLL